MLWPFFKLIQVGWIAHGYDSQLRRYRCEVFDVTRWVNFVGGFSSHKNKTATKFDHNVKKKKLFGKKKLRSQNTVDGQNPKTTKDDYAIIYRVLTIPGGAGFRPSTVSPPKQDSAKKPRQRHFLIILANSEAKIAFSRPCTCWVFVEVVCLKNKSPRNAKTKNKQKHPKVGNFFLEGGKSFTAI